MKQRPSKPSIARLSAIILWLLALLPGASVVVGTGDVSCSSPVLRETIKQLLRHRLQQLGYSLSHGGAVDAVDRLEPRTTELATVLRHEYMAKYDVPEADVAICSVKSQSTNPNFLLTVLVRDPRTGRIIGQVSNWGVGSVETFGGRLK